MSGGVFVTHWSCITAAGRSAKESAFGVRAGVNVLREGALLAKDGEPITIAAVPTLDPYLVGHERLGVLLQTALAQLLARIADKAFGLRVAVRILLDEVAGGGGAPFDVRDWIRGWVAEEVRKVTGSHCSAELIEHGAPGLADAFRRVEAEAPSGSWDAVILVAAHTDYCSERLEYLDRADRIYSSDNLDAVLLGEGAAALLIAHPVALRHLRERGGIAVVSSDLRREAATIENDESAFTAAGLTVAARQVTDGVPPSGWICSDASFEVFRSQELQAVLTRLQQRFTMPQQLDALQQRIGFLGAAYGAIQLAFVAEAYLRGFAPSSQCVCFLGSDTGVRSALRVAPLT